MFGQQTGFPPAAPPQMQRNGPPPQKKVKGGMVITRYAVPPRYGGPQQPQYPPQNWPQPASTYGNGQPQYPGYQHPGYAPQAPYPNNQLPGWPPQSQPPAMFQPPNSYPPAPQVYPPQHWHPPSTNTVPPGPPVRWQDQPNFAPQAADARLSRNNSTSHSSHGSIHFQSSTTPVHLPSELLDGNGEPIPEEKPEPEIEVEYCEGTYYLRHPEDVNPDLSLGYIHWTAPLPARRALPSTYAEAEEEIENPRPPLVNPDGSISEFFIRSKREEALISVRDTADWPEVQDDLIFRDFCPANEAQLVSSEELRARYRDRPDPDWAVRAEDLDSDSEWEATQDRTIYQAQSRESSTRRHSRANSSTNGFRNRSISSDTRSQVVGHSQEDILAALGVSGSPKPVIQPPGNSFAGVSTSISPPPPPPPPPRVGSSSRHNSYNGAAHAAGPGPGSLSHQRSYSNSSWRGTSQSYSNGYHGTRHNSASSQHLPDRPDRNPVDYDATPRARNTSWDAGERANRRGSNSSQHTAVGSDFQMDDQDVTPRATTSTRSDTRKRPIEAVEIDDPRDRYRQHRDSVSSQRNKLPRVDDAFKRRW